MKSWPAVVLLLSFAVVALVLRTIVRERVLGWLVRRSGATRASGRAQALLLFGGSSILGVMVLAVGYVCRASDAAWNAGRFVAAAAVIGAYLPVATLGAPKMTRWQATFEQRLRRAGGAPESAHGAASIARPVSALAVIIAVAAIPLFF